MLHIVELKLIYVHRSQNLFNSGVPSFLLGTKRLRRLIFNPKNVIYVHATSKTRVWHAKYLSASTFFSIEKYKKKKNEIIQLGHNFRIDHWMVIIVLFTFQKRKKNRNQLTASISDTLEWYIIYRANWFILSSFGLILTCTFHSISGII